MAFSPSGSAEATEIAFLDVETSAPPLRRALLEFGAIVICPCRLVEVDFYSTLVQPADLDATFPVWAARRNGITYETISQAPRFREVADHIYDVLHGRVWAGHNIVDFDAGVIREAFAEIGRAPPEPKGWIDTLHVLRRRFGLRAGDMKMATLAEYFGLGGQTHRSLDDARMNLQVLKCCSAVLLLGGQFSAVFTSQISKYHEEESLPEEVTDLLEGTFLEVPNNVEAAAMDLDGPVSAVDGRTTNNSNAYAQVDPSPSCYSRFLEPDNVSTECIRISRTTVFQHQGAELQLRCAGLKVPFGVSTEFLPKLSLRVEIPDSLSKVLQFVDDLARNFFCGTSEWRPLIKRYRNGCPTVRLNMVPIVVSGDAAAATYSIDIRKRERTQSLVSRMVDAAQLEDLLPRGSKVDAFFSLQLYDYKHAGVRLLANRLLVHST